MLAVLVAFALAVIVLSYAWRVKSDHPRLRCGRAPIPILSFSSRALNWLAVGVVGSFFLGFPSFFFVGPAPEPGLGWCAVLFSALFSYDVCAVVWYAGQYHWHYEPPSQVAVAGDAGFTLAADALAANAAADLCAGGADRPARSAMPGRVSASTYYRPGALL